MSLSLTHEHPLTDSLTHARIYSPKAKAKREAKAKAEREAKAKAEREAKAKVMLVRPRTIPPVQPIGDITST